MPRFRTIRSWAPPLKLIIAFAAAPAIVAAAGVSTSRFSETCIHVIRFCFATLSDADIFFHWAPMLAVGSPVIFVSIRTAIRLARWHKAMAGLKVRRLRTDDKLYALSAREGLLDIVRIIDSDAPAMTAFTMGLSPSIYISTRLELALSTDELEAVLLHEAHHARNNHPVRALLLAWVGEAFFWLPAVRARVEVQLQRLEFTADEAAARVGRRVVASAMIKTAELAAKSPLCRFATAMHGPSIEQRIRRLVNSGAEADTSVPSRMRTGRTMGVLALLWVMAISSAFTHAEHATAQTGHTGHSGPSGHCHHHHVHKVLHVPS